MIRGVPTGDLGLDVLLGGGWRLIKRFEDKESATVIVRGGSGAGKTLVGIQAAIELARALGGDVAVGCVEILPSEYIAQLQSARPSLAADRVARLPSRAVADDGPRVYVGLLQLETDQPDLVTALEQLDARVREAGGNPTAFIVDSLIDGYGIGSTIERIVADDVLRFAANYGYALVLCEEIASDAPSPWVFAADTVLQVGVESRERGRWIEVKKHRFAHSETGRYELDLAGAQHPRVFPSSVAWSRRGLGWILDGHGWAHSGSPQVAPILELTRVRPVGTSAKLAPVTGLFTVVSADNPEAARAMALSLEPDRPGGKMLLLELDPLFSGDVAWRGASVDGAYVPSSRGPARSLRALIERTGSALRQAHEFRCILLGDLGTVLVGEGAHDWAEAIRTFVARVVDANWGIPLIAYDGSGAEISAARTQLLAQADVAIEVTARHRTWATTVAERWPRRKREFTVESDGTAENVLAEVRAPFGRA